MKQTQSKQKQPDGEQAATQHRSSESAAEPDSLSNLPRFLNPRSSAIPRSTDEQEANRVSTDVTGRNWQSAAASQPAARTGGTLPRFMGSRSTQALPFQVRQEFEQHTGQSVDDVKIHRDGAADAANRVLDAQAFAYGRDIFFRGDTYQPDTIPGRWLIYHELTHAVQQQAASPRVQRFPDVSVFETSISEEYVQGMNSEDVTDTIDSIVDYLNAAAVDTATVSATAMNLRILINEARRRYIPIKAEWGRAVAYYTDGDLAPIETIYAFKAQVDLVMAVVRQKFSDQVDVLVPALEAYKDGLDSLLTDQVAGEQARIQTSLYNLDILQRYDAFVPTQRIEGDLKSSADEFRRSIQWAVVMLFSEHEEQSMAYVEAAKQSYLDTFTRTFLDTFETARQQLSSSLATMGNEDELFRARQGYAQSGRIVFGALQNQIGELQFYGEGLLNAMNAVGDIGKVTGADIETRVRFLAESGDKMMALLQKSRAIQAAYYGLVLYNALATETADEDQVKAGDYTLARDVREHVIDASLEVLKSGEIGESMDSIENRLVDEQGAVQRRMQELADIRRRMGWFVNIVSTLVGMRAFTAVSGAIATRLATSNLLVRGAVSFTLGSLAFTGASAGTRALLTLQLPTLSELGEQALMDMATLGIIKGAHMLVGLRYGGAANLPPAVAHTTTFVALWGWSSGLQIYKDWDKLTPAGVGSILAETGVHTAIDLAVLTFLHSSMNTPRLRGSTSSDLAPTLEAQWNKLQGNYRRVGEEMRRWYDSAERAVPEGEALLERGRSILGEMRAMIPRFVEAKMITTPEAQALDAQFATEARAAANTRDAMRLGIEPTGDIGFSYRGTPENLLQYLTRLQQQGQIRWVREGRNYGIVEVMSAEGQFRVFYPRGTSSPTADIIDITAEGVRRAAPDVPETVSGQAVSSLRLLPPAETRQLAAELETTQASAVVRWLARPDTRQAMMGPDNAYWGNLIRDMIRSEPSRTRILGERASALRAWYESGFERTTAGQKDAQSFQRFLTEIETYAGTLDVATPAEARSIVDAYLRTAPAVEFDPVKSYRTRPPSVSAIDSPRSPFQGIEHYLVQAGITHGSFVQASLPEGTWVVQAEGSSPVRAMRFPRGGYPPDQTLEIAQDIRDIRAAVEAAEAAPAQAGTMMRGVAGQVARLEFLTRMRNAPAVVKETQSLLQRAMQLGRPQLLLSAAPQPLLLAPPAPPTALQLRGQALETRRQAIRDRATATGMLSDSIIENAIARRPTRTTQESTMSETAQLIEAAERQLNVQSEQALSNRFGGREGQRMLARIRRSRGLGESDISDQAIGDALHVFRGRQGLGEAQLRGLIYAHKAGADLSRILDNAPSAAERNRALDLAGRLMEAGIPGTEHIVRDLARSATSWRGSVWAFEYVRQHVPDINQIARFESTETTIIEDTQTGQQRGIERRYDIVMRDGRRIELKSWTHWFGDSLRWQFEKDVLLRTRNFNEPTGIFQQNYAFEGRPNIPELQQRLGHEPNAIEVRDFIREQFRSRLIRVMNQQGVDSLTRKFMLEAFDHHQHMVQIYE